MPVVSELLTRRPEAKEGVLKTELRINGETRELFISDEIGERQIVLKGLVGWATLSSLVKHSNTLGGATNKDLESDVEAEGVDFLQRAGDYIFNLRRAIERDPKEPKIIIRTGSNKKPQYHLVAEISSTEETRLKKSTDDQDTDRRQPEKPKQPRSLYPIILGKPWDQKPVPVQEKSKKEARQIVMVDDRVARVLGQTLLFRPNWQYLGQALARHGVKIDEGKYRELQRYHNFFRKTMESDGADSQALNFLAGKTISKFAAGQRQAIIDAQTSDYARFLLELLAPLPKEELLEVFEEMRSQFVTKAHLL